MAGLLIRELIMRADVTLCERKGWAEDARAYNELVIAWSVLNRPLSSSSPRSRNKAYCCKGE